MEKGPFELGFLREVAQAARRWALTDKKTTRCEILEREKAVKKAVYELDLYLERQS